MNSLSSRTHQTQMYFLSNRIIKNVLYRETLDDIGFLIHRRIL